MTSANTDSDSTKQPFSAEVLDSKVCTVLAS